MLVEKLIVYVCNGRKDSLYKAITYWIKSNTRFAGFVKKYKDKIRKKLRSAKNNDVLEDIKSELEMACLLLKNEHFNVEYEKYIRSGKCPDFTVSINSGATFNLEVARIRKTSPEACFEAWCNNISEQIRTIPSNVGVSFNYSLDSVPSIIKELESSKPETIQFIRDSIKEADGTLLSGKECSYYIPGFKDAIRLNITKPLKKTNQNKTSYYGGLFPIFFTNREYRKIGDIVCAKLAQMLPNCINILAISSNTNTHDATDCEDALNELYKLALNGNDEFFTNKKDFHRNTSNFISQAKRLSGVLFRSTWINSKFQYRNVLWCNQKAALKIPKPVVQYLQSMD